MNVLRKTLNSSESSQPLRGPRQITFIMLNSFCPLSKKNPSPPSFYWTISSWTECSFFFFNGFTHAFMGFLSFLSIFPKMPSEIFFFQKFIDRILRKYLPRFQLQILWFSFQNIFQESYFHTSICNYL